MTLLLPSFSSSRSRSHARPRASFSWSCSPGSSRRAGGHSPVFRFGYLGAASGEKHVPKSKLFWALSENLTKRPLLRNFLHPLNCEEPTLVTAIRLAMDERHRSGWFERDAEGAGLRLNWAGHGER